MSDWNVGKAEKWLKVKLKSGEETLFRVSDVKYVMSDGDGCNLTMNDGKVFAVKFGIANFFNLL